MNEAFEGRAPSTSPTGRWTSVSDAKPAGLRRPRANDLPPMSVGLTRAATHERNDVGRDFVAGDLVNRGPHSLDALKWLEERRIHAAVLGNHEAMVLKTLLNRERRVLLGWMAGIDDALRERWIEAVWRLPVAMTIETAHGPVGVVHAGVVDRSWTRTLEGLARRDQYVLSAAVLGGYGADRRGTSGTPIKGLRALVTGHEPSSEPSCDGYWWSIDTGAGVRRFERLTLLRIDCEPMAPHTVDVVASERLPPPRGRQARQSQGG